MNGKYKASTLARALDMSTVRRRKKDGVEVPARPITFWTMHRFRMAWDVIFMKADALYWDDQ
jgi:hypothetical protein